MYSSDVKEACQSLIRHKKRVGPLVLECMSHTSGGHVELPSGLANQSHTLITSRVAAESNRVACSEAAAAEEEEGGDICFF